MKILSRNPMLKTMMVLVAITFISSAALCQGQPDPAGIATQDALARDWNVYSSGYDYQKASASSLKVSKVELAEGSTYKVTGTLTITHNYPQWNYSWTETKEVEYYVDTSTSRVTRIIYDPNNQWGRTVIDIFTDHEVMTRNYTYTWGDYSSTNSTTVTTYFDINGNRTTEQGTEAYTSSYKGTQNYNYQRSWNTVFSGNTITTDSSWSYTYSYNGRTYTSTGTYSQQIDLNGNVISYQSRSVWYDEQANTYNYYESAQHDGISYYFNGTGAGYPNPDRGQITITSGSATYQYNVAYSVGSDNKIMTVLTDPQGRTITFDGLLAPNAIASSAPSAGIATQDALARDWNVYSSGYDYQKASASSLKVSKVELAEGSTYKVTGTLTITHNYPQWNYSWTETKEVEYYVDTSTSRVTRIIYDPNNQWGRTVIDIFTDHEVMTRNYTYTWGDYSSGSTTTVTTYFDINGNRTTEQGTEAYTSSYKGTQNYNYQRSWNTVFSGNTITTDSSWNNTYNGTQQSSGSQKTVSVYSDTGSLISRTDTYSSTYDNYEYSGIYESTYDSVTHNIRASSGRSLSRNRLLNRLEYEYLYEYVYDGTGNWNPVSYYSESKRYDEARNAIIGSGSGMIGGAVYTNDVLYDAATGEAIYSDITIGGKTVRMTFPNFSFARTAIFNLRSMALTLSAASAADPASPDTSSAWADPQILFSPSGQQYARINYKYNGVTVGVMLEYDPASGLRLNNNLMAEIWRKLYTEEHLIFQAIDWARLAKYQVGGIEDFYDNLLEVEPEGIFKPTTYHPDFEADRLIVKNRGAILDDLGQGWTFQFDEMNLFGDAYRTIGITLAPNGDGRPHLTRLTEKLTYHRDAAIESMIIESTISRYASSSLGNTVYWERYRIANDLVTDIATHRRQSETVDRSERAILFAKRSDGTVFDGFAIYPVIAQESELIQYNYDAGGLSSSEKYITRITAEDVPFSRIGVAALKQTIDQTFLRYEREDLSVKTRQKERRYIYIREEPVGWSQQTKELEKSKIVERNYEPALNQRRMWSELTTYYDDTLLNLPSVPATVMEKKVLRGEVVGPYVDETGLHPAVDDVLQNIVPGYDQDDDLVITGIEREDKFVNFPGDITLSSSKLTKIRGIMIAPDPDRPEDLIGFESRWSVTKEFELTRTKTIKERELWEKTADTGGSIITKKTYKFKKGSLGATTTDRNLVAEGRFWDGTPIVKKTYSFGADPDNAGHNKTEYGVFAAGGQKIWWLSNRYDPASGTYRTEEELFLQDASGRWVNTNLTGAYTITNRGFNNVESINGFIDAFFRPDGDSLERRITTSLDLSTIDPTYVTPDGVALGTRSGSDIEAEHKFMISPYSVSGEPGYEVATLNSRWRYENGVSTLRGQTWYLDSDPTTIYEWGGEASLPGWLVPYEDGFYFHTSFWTDNYAYSLMNNELSIMAQNGSLPMSREPYFPETSPLVVSRMSDLAIDLSAVPISNTNEASDPGDGNAATKTEVDNKLDVDAAKTNLEGDIGSGISKTGERADSGDLKPNLNP